MTVDELRAREAELKHLQEHAAAQLNFVNGQLSEVQAWIAKATTAEAINLKEETPQP